MRSRDAVSRAADVAWARWQAGLEAREARAVDAANRLMIAIAEETGELTRREHQVLQLVADGNTDREIGAALSISEQTVKSHVKWILLKLCAKNRTHAAYIGLRSGLIQ